MQSREPAGRAKDVPQTAVHRKEARTLVIRQGCVGCEADIAHGLLARLVSLGLERKHDRKDPGRTPCLGGKRQRVVGEHRGKSPKDGGFSRGNRAARPAARMTESKFDASYINSGALRLARRPAFSVRKPVSCRTTHHSSGDKRPTPGRVRRPSPDGVMSAASYGPLTRSRDQT